MQQDETLFGADATKAREGTTEADEHADELSRAAREAVRQPADPRLEKTFAHLGLAADEAAASAAPRVGRADAPGVQREDLEPIVAGLASLRASTDRMARQLRWVNLAIALLTIAVVALAALWFLGQA